MNYASSFENIFYKTSVDNEFKKRWWNTTEKKRILSSINKTKVKAMKIINLKIIILKAEKNHSVTP